MTQNPQWCTLPHRHVNLAGATQNISIALKFFNRLYDLKHTTRLNMHGSGGMVIVTISIDIFHVLKSYFRKTLEDHLIYTINYQLE